MQSLTFITFMVSEKTPMLKFSTNLDTWPTKDVQNLPWTHISVTQFILCMIFLMLVATIQHLNYSWQEPKQESKKHNLQLIFLTHLWLKQNLTLFMRLYICPHSLCDILSLSSSSLWCSMSALILFVTLYLCPLLTLYICPHSLCDTLSLPSSSLWHSISALALPIMLFVCPHSLCDTLSLPSCDTLSLPSSSLWHSVSALILFVTLYLCPLLTLYLCPHPPCDALCLPSSSLWYSISALILFVMLYLCPHPLCDTLSLPSSSLWCSISALILFMTLSLSSSSLWHSSLPSSSLWCSMSALILLRYSISAHILLVTLYLCPHPLCDILSLPSPSLWRSISAFSSLRRWSSCMLDTMAGNFSSSWLLSRISLPIQSCNVLHASVTQPVNSPLVICI